MRLIENLEQRGHRGRKRRHWSLRWAVLLPVLTLLVFGALCVVSFIEIRSTSPGKRKDGRSVEEISAEVLSRYREESRKLVEIRTRERAGLSQADLLRPFAVKGEGEEGDRSFPSRASLLSGFQALRSQGAHHVGPLLSALIPLWDQALRRKTTNDYEIELIETLFLQAVLSLDEDPGVNAPERQRVLDLTDLVVRRGGRGLGGLALYLRRVAEPEDIPRLRTILKNVQEVQLKFEIEKLIGQLGSRAGSTTQARDEAMDRSIGTG